MNLAKEKVLFKKSNFNKIFEKSSILFAPSQSNLSKKL